MPATLRIEALRASYGAIEVLHGIDLNLDPGEVGVVLGANGAGKTTLLRAISGLVRRQGHIQLNGVAIDRMPAHAIARHGVAHVPDNRGTFAELTVDDNLRLGSYRFSNEVAYQDGRRRAQSYFPRLEERQGQVAGSLSGGEQQMLAIARALMMRPKLLILDEPSFGLAPLIVREIYRILARIRKEEGVSMLIVEQHAHVALGLGDNAHVLELGKITMSGSAETIAADPVIQRSYLGH